MEAGNSACSIFMRHVQRSAGACRDRLRQPVRAEREALALGVLRDRGVLRHEPLSASNGFERSPASAHRRCTNAMGVRSDDKSAIGR